MANRTFVAKRRARAILEAVEPRRLMAVMDPSFGGDGNPVGDGVVNYSNPEAVILASSGEVLGNKVLSIAQVFGPAEGQYQVRRYDAAGTLEVESDFNLGILRREVGGTQFQPSFDSVRTTSIVTQADGSAYLAGELGGSDRVGFVARLTSTGVLDTAFGGAEFTYAGGTVVRAGVSFFQPDDGDVSTPHLAVSGDGTLNIGANVNAGISALEPRIALLKFNPSGSAAGSANVFSTPGYGGTLDSVIVSGDSLILAGDAFINAPDAGADRGSASALFAGKFDASGTLSSAFGFTAITDNQDAFDISGAALTASGALIVGGNITLADGYSFGGSKFIKLAAGLTLDGSFSPENDGIVDFSLDRNGRLNDTNDLNYGVAVDADGNIYGVGYDTYDTATEANNADAVIVRLTADGALDLGFDADGHFEHSEGKEDYASAISLTSTGAPLVTTVRTGFFDGGAQYHGVSVLKLNPADAGPGTTPTGRYTLTGEQLSITGGIENDTIIATRNSAGKLVLNDGGVDYVIDGTVSSIVMNGGAGDDELRVSAGMTTPATLIGGLGNDVLRGGAGNDVLLGDEGDDIIVGRDGRDVLVGGTGADVVLGSEDADVLISGTTSYASSNLAAYSAIQAEWTSNSPWITRVVNLSGLSAFPGRRNGDVFLTPGLNVINDSSVDTVSGGAGSDFYFVSLTGPNHDRVKDDLSKFPPAVELLVTGD